jgi:prepilin signal peptidase PulO-like enzyme (type II secretory pathway)
LLLHYQDILFFFLKIFPFYFFALHFLQYLVSKGKWTGLGDADLGGVIGIIMGPVYGIQTIFCAYLMGSIYGVGLLTAGKAKRDSRIAFGPFLLFALFINVLFWDKIMQILTLNF